MTTLLIDDVAPRVYYVATASQTEFLIPFVFFADGDLTVYVNDVLKVLTTDYTVTGAGSNTDATRKLTFNAGLTLNDRVAIIRDVAAARTTLFPTSGPLNIDSLNSQINRIFAILQQWESLLDRTIKLADSDTPEAIELPAAADRAGKALGFDADGNIVATASITEAVVSAFMETVLTASTAAAARSTLGAQASGSYAAASHTHVVADLSNIDADSVKLLTNLTVSTSAPSGGADGDYWFERAS